MPEHASVRSAEEVLEAQMARQERLSLVLSLAVQRIIRSKRTLVAARLKLARLRRKLRKSAATASEPVV
jgi:hypothetical protein